MADDEKAGDLCTFGVYGLGTMGLNLALNAASKGIRTAVGNRSPEKVDAALKAAKEQGNLPMVGFKDVGEFVRSVARPRKILMMVTAGAPVDGCIATLVPFMEAGDILIDGANEWFPLTIKRGKELQEKGILYIGMGISGGEEGARHGPSLMPGCSREAYDLVEPILSKLAAKQEAGPCVAYLGDLGCGNYVKMVHNGIEYAFMQLTAEAFDILRTVGDMSNDDIAKVFAEWNAGELESFLIDITAKILPVRDPETGDYLVDKILDAAGNKGTGKWTVQEAAERSVGAFTMGAALFARYLSALKSERVAASSVISGPVKLPKVDNTQLIDDVRGALYAAVIVSFAEGLNLIRAASIEHDWNVNLSECARIWKSGCIIRARLLDRIKAAYERNADLVNLLVDREFAEEVNSRQLSWRRVVSLSAAVGIPVPCFGASLCYLDTYRRDRLPAALSQAQRDYFGAHTFKRVDKEGDHHFDWYATGDKK